MNKNNKHSAHSKAFETMGFILELMPTCIPDSVESYLDTIKAVDREQFAVHLDPVNIMGTHRAYARTYENG